MTVRRFSPGRRSAIPGTGELPLSQCLFEPPDSAPTWILPSATPTSVSVFTRVIKAFFYSSAGHMARANWPT